MFSKFSLPLLKKSYPRLIANSIVGVQPLSGPTGLVFYLRHKYAGRLPASDELCSSIKLWFTEEFWFFTINSDKDNSHEWTIIYGGKEAKIGCYERNLQFADAKFDYNDPDFFDLLRAAIERYFFT